MDFPVRKPLPYGPGDDSSAEEYVRQILRRPGPVDWSALLAGDRVVQTYRVLRRIESRAAQIRVRHRETVALAGADRDAGRITAAQYADRYREYTAWRERAAVFDRVVQQYLDMAADRVRVVRGDVVADSLRDVLLTLAMAVAEHREAHAGDESLADTALWARLRILPWPTTSGTERRALADAVEAERARRRSARTASDDAVEFRGGSVFGETVDVADLLLDVTDHTRPACDRDVLTELWKRNSADLLDSPAARVTAVRQKGSYSTQRLRKALLFLEKLGLVARVSDDVGAKVVVTDRAGLAELRRRWDDRHSGLDDLEHR
jgi:hypothetical protein